MSKLVHSLMEKLISLNPNDKELIGTTINTARLRKFVGWVERKLNPTKPC